MGILYQARTKNDGDILRPSINLEDNSQEEELFASSQDNVVDPDVKDKKDFKEYVELEYKEGKTEEATFQFHVYFITDVVYKQLSNDDEYDGNGKDSEVATVHVKREKKYGFNRL